MDKKTKTAILIYTKKCGLTAWDDKNPIHFTGWNRHFRLSLVSMRMDVTEDLSTFDRFANSVATSFPVSIKEYEFVESFWDMMRSLPYIESKKKSEKEREDELWEKRKAGRKLTTRKTREFKSPKYLRVIEKDGEKLCQQS